SRRDAKRSRSSPVELPGRKRPLTYVFASLRVPESFERQLGDRVTKRLKSLASLPAPDLSRREPNREKRPRTTRIPPRREDPRPRRVMGGAHPPPGFLRGGVPRRAVRCAYARRQGRPRPPQPHGAPHRQRDPRRVLRGRR